MGIRIVLVFTLVSFLTMISITSAAMVHGTVYDMELEPAENIVLTINSTPKQMFVAKNGTYSFTVAPGDYIISAECRPRYRRCGADENITITDDGDYVVDLILFPDFSEEDAIFNEGINLSLDEDVSENKKPAENSLFYLTVALAVFAFLAALLGRNRTLRHKIVTERNDMADNVVEFIKSEGGRTTQKEIRKHFPFSEAKISLVLTDLEDKGLIRKIKRGKGNVIVLEN
ncbi:MAG: hypothetical protein GXO64_01195 [Candidatus Micrarchaeota archaeon]|nr:hypothetical protein [Candidatus Micrarchaeota archaeon]